MGTKKVTPPITVSNCSVTNTTAPANEHTRAAVEALALSDRFTLMQGDCLVRLRELADSSVDAIVTDPPYGLSFMGKRWDYDVPSVEVWAECLRVLKPGGHLLAFAGTRTQHRMAVRIEDAGFDCGLAILTASRWRPLRQS
jgi:DNA modification methylase